MPVPLPGQKVRARRICLHQGRWCDAPRPLRHASQQLVVDLRERRLPERLLLPRARKDTAGFVRTELTLFTRMWFEPRPVVARIMAMTMRRTIIVALVLQ